MTIPWFIATPLVFDHPDFTKYSGTLTCNKLFQFEENIKNSKCFYLENIRVNSDSGHQRKEKITLMELFYYLFIALLGVLFSISNQLVKNPKIFFSIWFASYIGLSLVIRNQFDADIEVYADSMSYSSLSIYYLREPIVWLGQRWLFVYFQSHYIVFFIYDILTGVLLFKAFAKFRVPKYAYFGMLTFFPFILGMQNIYRQWIASVVLLYAFSFVWERKLSYRAYVLFLFSCLTHNAAAIFVPMLFLNSNKKIGKLFWIVSFFISFAGIYFGGEVKSSANTGANLSVAYLILLFIVILVVVALDKGKIRQIRKVEYKLILGLFLLSLFSTLILSSAGSERISMFCLILIYPVLAILFEERFRQRSIVRIIYLAMGFSPMFVFSVSKFITNDISI